MSKTYTTQLTHKTFKAQKVMSVLMMIIGFVIIFTGDAADPSPWGAGCVLGGLLWYIVNRIRIWWNHA